MGQQDRRSREKEAMKALILEQAYKLIEKKGFNNLTIRVLAESIEYSPSTIYEYFENKEFICRMLCDQICKELLEELHKISPCDNPEEYLLKLIQKNVEFLQRKPAGIELLTITCFGMQGSYIPSDFNVITKLFANALTLCNCHTLQDEEEMQKALDVIRSLHVGMLTLCRFETSLEGKKRITNSLENGIKTLIKGWKKL